MFEVGIGTSQEWDPEKAAEEVISQALKKLSQAPKFVLLFSTIHYEKNNGFQKILDSVYTKIPKKIPLLGGTVAGFMNNSGCYSRGLTILACYSNEIEVAIGIGHDTKRNPQKAALSVAKQLKNKNHKENNYILSIYSAGCIPSFPGFPRENVINSKLKAKIALKLTDFSLKTLQKGIGRDEEYLKKLVEEFPNSKILNGSMIDDITCLRNYQFYKTEVFTNTSIALSIKTKIKADVFTTTGLKETGKEFEITEINKDKTIILKINNKPAREELLRILKWPSEFLSSRLYDRIWYYPVSFTDGNKEIPAVIPLIMGDYLLSAFPIKSKKMKILTTCGKELIGATKENIQYFKNKTNDPLLGLISSCGIRLLTLKSNEMTEQKILKEYFKENPFLLFFVAGEATYNKKNKLKYGNDTFNMMVFWK